MAKILCSSPAEAPAVLKNVFGTRLSIDLVMTSGGFDPLHRGHAGLFQELRSLGPPLQLQSSFTRFVAPRVLVLVNGDEWLRRKKGYVLLPLEDRLHVVAALAGVDYVVPWDDGTPTVSAALEMARPNVFAKGGDRSDPASVPEYETCQRIGCEVRFGVGGSTKAQSSSDLVRALRENALREKQRAIW